MTHALSKKQEPVFLEPDQGHVRPELPIGLNININAIY